MGCTQSSPASKPEAKEPQAKPEASAPPEAGKPKSALGAASKVKAGDTVCVSLDGGFEAEVLRCTTTDVLVKGSDGTERWCEMEDVRAKATATGPPLEIEVQVGQRVTSASGVAGTVVKRTTTEVCVKKDGGGEVWVDIEEISFLRVSIQGASGLRNADTFSKSDPYCICQLEGKPETKVQTQVTKDNVNPEWNFEVKMVAYERGDVLLFEVYVKDVAIKSDDFLGKAKLTSEQVEGNGFFGDLQLEDGSNPCKGSLRIQVRLEKTELGQPEAEPGPTVEEVVKASPPKGCCW
mmetsp:Transcript_182225/g.443467  ORF Transcript_182225/g.443467 Transcript_182225/m.443467 type:complete len:293 (+) Transcript_182225:112-990(+)